MEDRRRQRSSLTVGLALMLLGVLAEPALGWEEGLSDARTNGSGIDVRLARYGDGTGRARSSDGSCDWRAVPYTTAGEFGQLPVEAIPDRPSDEHELYVAWCGTSGTKLYWLGPSNFVDPTGPLVEEVLRRVAVRPVEVSVRPESRGITGIESLFWLEGPGSAAFSESVSAFGITVEVSVALAGVEWDFGDGSPVRMAGLGEAWPQRSSVAHAYRDSSGDGPYTVTARLVFQPSYTVDGVPGAALEPIVVPVERAYPVNQVQAVRRY